MRQSSQPSAPWISGEPEGAGSQPVAANLSCAPPWPNVRHRRRCAAERMLTAKAPELAIRRQLLDPVEGASAMSGGASDSAKNDWQVSPAGPASSTPVTTTTPL